MPRLPKSSRVIVVSQCILRLKPCESPKPLHEARWLNDLGILHLAQEQIRSRIGGIQIGRIEQARNRLTVRSANIPAHAERDQRPDRLREEAITFGKDFNGRLSGAMSQKLGSPIEEMRFARVHFRGALVLANS